MGVTSVGGPRRPIARNHTTARFGLAREVERGLVLEIAFDAAQRSARHKSDVAMRFPRVARIRRDKLAAEADRPETLLRHVDASGELPEA